MPEILSKKMHIFFSFFVLLLSFFQTLSAHTIDEQLHQLSSEERESLEHFFATAIKHDHLGHVLFFPNKPACLSGQFISEKQTPNDSLFLKGWNVWQKKEHCFPHPNFIIYHEQVNFGEGKRALHIYFINKQTLSDYLSKHERRLNEILEEPFSKETFLKSLEEKNVDSLFGMDHVLKGILLGYGLESPKAFKQSKLQKNNTLTLILCTRHGEIDLERQPQMFTLSKEANILPVTFFGNPHSKEVQLLQEKYTDELEQIERIFQEKELLKLSLQALCQDQTEK